MAAALRILLLTHSFNGLAQRLFAELGSDGHEVSVEFDIADSVTEEAVALFAPDVIVAPFLKRAVPESIWRRHLTLIVHPGIIGDRGPSALDWALQAGEAEWGVTVLQAEVVKAMVPAMMTQIALRNMKFSFFDRCRSASSLLSHALTLQGHPVFVNRLRVRPPGECCARADARARRSGGFDRWRGVPQTTGGRERR